jgi:OmpA family
VTTVRLIGALALVLLTGSFARAEDIEGGKDHPLAGRFKDSSIVYYSAKDFDELAFMNAPVDYAALLDRNATDDRSGPEWLKLHGRANEPYNLDLSSRRAANVAAALVGGYGIDPARLTPEGAGMSRPLASNDTDEGRAKNRRVELVAR